MKYKYTSDTQHFQTHCCTEIICILEDKIISLGLIHSSTCCYFSFEGWRLGNKKKIMPTSCTGNYCSSSSSMKTSFPLNYIFQTNWPLTIEMWCYFCVRNLCSAKILDTCPRILQILSVLSIFIILISFFYSSYCSTLMKEINLHLLPDSDERGCRRAFDLASWLLPKRPIDVILEEWSVNFLVRHFEWCGIRPKKKQTRKDQSPYFKAWFLHSAYLMIFWWPSR